MSTINVVVIPFDNDKPVRRESYDTTNYKNLTRLIFDGGTDGTFSCMTSADSLGHEVTFWFDDEGLLRNDAGNRINARAMQLFGHLEGVGVEDFAVPLVGDYVITGGVDDEGESLDAPGWVMDFGFTWTAKASA
jgi:hypothetical protein